MTTTCIYKKFEHKWFKSNRYLYTHYNSELRVSGSKRGAVNAIDLLRLHVTEICNQSKFFIFCFIKIVLFLKIWKNFPKSFWPFGRFKDSDRCVIVNVRIIVQHSYYAVMQVWVIYQWIHLEIFVYHNFEGLQKLCLTCHKYTDLRPNICAHHRFVSRAWCNPIFA